METLWRNSTVSRNWSALILKDSIDLDDNEARELITENMRLLDLIGKMAASIRGLDTIARIALTPSGFPGKDRRTK